MRNCLLVLVFLASSFGGCAEELADAVDQLRAAAPDVCKDYCEDRVTCEWQGAAGDRETDAFGAAIKRCVIDCAWYMDDGAFVVETGIVDLKSYVDKVPGHDLEDTLECIYSAAGFRCEEQVGGDQHMFSPPVESICNLSGGCMGTLGIDYLMLWNPSTSTCQVTGTQTVEAVFF